MAATPTEAFEALAPVAQKKIRTLAQKMRVQPAEAYAAVAALNPKPKDQRITQWLVKQTTAPGVLSRNQLLVETFLQARHRLPLYAVQGQNHSIEAYTPTSLREALETLAAGYGISEHVASYPNGWEGLKGFPGEKKLQPVFALNRIAAADPHGLTSVPHIVRWLENGSALPEDLPDVRLLLCAYEKHRDKMQPLGAYARLPDLSQAMPGGAYTGEQRARFEQKAVAAGGARLLWQSGEALLYQVTSERGAQLLGRGTQWCTRHEDGNNKFKDYADDLLYLRQGDEVFQLHARTRQFRDRHDEEVPLAGLLKAAPGLAAQLQGPVERGIGQAFVTELEHHLRFYTPSACTTLSQTAGRAVRARLPTAVPELATGGFASTLARLLDACWKTEDAELKDLACQLMVKHLAGTLVGQSHLFGKQRFLKACWESGDDRLCDATRTWLGDLPEHARHGYRDILGLVFHPVPAASAKPASFAP